MAVASTVSAVTMLWKAIRKRPMVFGVYSMILYVAGYRSRFLVRSRYCPVQGLQVSPFRVFTLHQIWSRFQFRNTHYYSPSHRLAKGCYSRLAFNPFASPSRAGVYDINHLFNNTRIKHKMHNSHRKWGRLQQRLNRSYLTRTELTFTCYVV
jgi:hypothetical protein